MLLGRDFFRRANIRLVYQNSTFEFEYSSSPDKEINTIFSINVIKERNKWDVVCKSLDKDLDYNTKSQLLQVFEEVDNLRIKPVEDNYAIRVYIKDSSLYRYAPRRILKKPN